MSAPTGPVSDAVVLGEVLDLLRAEHKRHATWCESCKRRHIRGEMPGPWVDVAPVAIAAGDEAAHNRVVTFIAQAPAHRLGDGHVRIPVPDTARAVTVAAHLHSLGAPQHAVHIGGHE